ncbi:hypothetical protein NECAME_02081, partial [Necator americanus]
MHLPNIMANQTGAITIAQCECIPLDNRYWKHKRMIWARDWSWTDEPEFGCNSGQKIMEARLQRSEEIPVDDSPGISLSELGGFLCSPCEGKSSEEEAMVRSPIELCFIYGVEMVTSSRLDESDDVVLDLLGLHHQIFEGRLRCKRTWRYEQLVIEERASSRTHIFLERHHSIFIISLMVHSCRCPLQNDLTKFKLSIDPYIYFIVVYKHNFEVIKMQG